MTVEKRHWNCSGAVRADEHTVFAGLEPWKLGVSAGSSRRYRDRILVVPRGLTRGSKEDLGLGDPPAPQTLLRGLNTGFGINSQSVAVLHPTRLLRRAFCARAHRHQPHGLEVVMSAGGVYGRGREGSLHAQDRLWLEASATKQKRPSAVSVPSCPCLSLSVP